MIVICFGWSMQREGRLPKVPTQKESTSSTSAGSSVESVPIITPETSAALFRRMQTTFSGGKNFYGFDIPFIDPSAEKPKPIGPGDWVGVPKPGTSDKEIQEQGSIIAEEPGKKWSITRKPNGGQWEFATIGQDGAKRVPIPEQYQQGAKEVKDHFERAAKEQEEEPSGDTKERRADVQRRDHIDLDPID
jgi:hypothetical protein